MKGSGTMRNGMRIGWCGVLIVALSLCGAAQAQQDVEFVEHALEQAHLNGGVCCVIGGIEPGALLNLLENTDLVVHVLADSEAEADELRRLSAGNGFILDRVVIEVVDAAHLDRLPYADNVADLVLAPWSASQSFAKLRPQESMRVLRPKGTVFFNTSIELEIPMGFEFPVEISSGKFGYCAKIVKPRPAGMGDWPHWEKAPDNNPVSDDTLIKAPYMTQFMALPYYITMPAITTVSDGRMFTSMGHIAHHEREEEWLNTLLARNGYNGEELWRKRLPDGYLAHRSAYAAASGAFFMIDLDGEDCLILDPETGDEIDRIQTRDIRGEWKWIAKVDDILYALIGKKEGPAETTVVRSQHTAWSWGELSAGYYEPSVPWGFGETIAAFDIKTKKMLWSYSEDARIDSRAMAMGGGALFFYAQNKHVSKLDAKSGKLIWTNDSKELTNLIEKPGKGLTSTPGFRSSCYCLYTPKGIFFGAQTRQKIVAVSTEDGSLMWSRDKTTSNPNAIYLDGNILVGIGKDGDTFVVDPKTGDTVENLGFRKRSCVRLTATSDSLFCRGFPEGVTRFDRNSKQITFNGALRPACNDGVIGANGLLYIGPWTCDCNLSLMGTGAYTTAPDNITAEFKRTAAADSLDAVQELNVADNDWPAYRGGNSRTGSTAAIIQSPSLALWEWAPKNDFTPSAPTAAGGLAFIAGDDGAVRALDMVSGEELWSFATAGPVLQAPTVWESRVYAGSGDGHVYCLEAKTGRLLWKFRAAPMERRIMIYGRLCSTWPVNTGVLVEDGVAYFAAGIIDFDGTYVFAIDARTGQIIWTNTTSGHLRKDLRKGVSAQGNITIMDGKLWMAGGNILSRAPYDLKTGEYLGAMPTDGAPESNRGEEIGVFADDIIMQGGRLLYSATKDIVNPGRFALSMQGGPEFMIATGKSTPVWDAALFVSAPLREASPEAYTSSALAANIKKSPGPNNPILPKPVWRTDVLRNSRVMALALAGDSVVVTCRTPLERQLKPRWRLCLINREDGRILDNHELGAAVRPNGLAIDAEGRILVAMADGSVRCFGGRNSFGKHIEDMAAKAAANESERPRWIERIAQALVSVRDYDSRMFVLDILSKQGVDVLKPAKDNGAVTNWRILGPTPWNNTDWDLSKVIIGEPDIAVDQQVEVSGKMMGWKPFITTHTSGMVDLRDFLGVKSMVAAYGYAEIELAEAGEILLQIGTNDGYIGWFNGQQVGRFDGGRGYRPDTEQVKVSAIKGVNKILLKISQHGGAWAMGIRVTDLEGNPIPFKCVTK